MALARCQRGASRPLSTAPPHTHSHVVSSAGQRPAILEGKRYAPRRGPQAQWSLAGVGRRPLAAGPMRTAHPHDHHHRLEDTGGGARRALRSPGLQQQQWCRAVASIGRRPPSMVMRPPARRFAFASHHSPDCAQRSTRRGDLSLRSRASTTALASFKYLRELALNFNEFTSDFR